MRRLFSLILAITAGCALTVGCSSSGTNGGNAGSGGNLNTPGCTAAPDCQACSDCYSKCACSTGDLQQCYPACGLPIPGTGGSGNTGNTGGFGNTGNTGGTGNVGNTGGTGNTGNTGGGTSTWELAKGMRITEVSVYQGVKIPIMQNGGEVGQKNAPVVAGRPALVRIFVTPDSGWVPRDVVARLELAGAPAQEISKFVSGPSSETNWQSAFNFDIPAEQMTPNQAYSVSIYEAGNPGVAATGSTDGARFPASGTSLFGAQSAGGALDVVLVPLVVNGYTPDTSAARVNAYKDRMFRLYPVDTVNMTVRSPVSFSGSVAPTSTSGWNNILDKLLSVRQQDNPKKDTYYYGVLTPTATFAQFCGGACIAGLSPQASANDVFSRGSVGLGFFPSGNTPGSPDTMAHEVGHAHGLPHAPCQTGDAGPFPYSGGIIGSYGYDIVAKGLLDPVKYKDMMGYCDPVWISDYNYNKLFSRITYVNSTADFIALDPDRAPGKFRSALIDETGAITWGHEYDMDTSPFGDKRTIKVLDDQGKTIKQITGFYYPVDHHSGGILLVRESTLIGTPAQSGLNVGQTAKLAF